MKKITLKQLVFSCLVLMLGPACSKEGDITQTIDKIIRQEISSRELFGAITSWGSSYQEVKQRVGKYENAPGSSSSSLCFYVSNKDIKVICDFRDDALTASCVYVASKEVDMTSPISAFSYVGDVVGSRIYKDEKSNTMAAIWGEEAAQILGLTPISDDSFDFTDDSDVPQGATDLGLSVYWANQNVGASTPEQYGKYYAWGETNTKSRYLADNYKWCNGVLTSLTKYNTDSAYGVVDGLTRLDIQDDAARQVLGGKWRIPTMEELDELQEECTMVEDYSLRLYNVTGPNGNKIIIPLAGSYYDKENDIKGYVAVLWSSDLYTSDPRRAVYLQLLGKSDGINRDSRSNGFPIRPVHD